MHNYTMTFMYDGDFDLPNDPEERAERLPSMVLDKMEKHDFELVDFNLSENYDNHVIDSYIKDPKLHRAVVEIRLDMSRSDMKSREAIYARCLQAMRDGNLSVSRAHENDDPEQGLLQSIIVFEKKDSYSETA